MAHSQISASITQYIIGGMSCAACSGRVERALEAVPGVEDAVVNLATHRARVVGEVRPEMIRAAVEAVGFEARVSDGEAERSTVRQERDAEMVALRRDLVLASICTLPVFVLEMGSHLIPAFHHFVMGTIGMQASWLIQWGLTTFVLAIPGRRFFAHGIPALLRGSPEMNSLVAVGTSAAYLYSMVATFLPSWLPAGSVHVYFEAAAVIVTLILLGRWLEARARGRASQAIERLVQLQPQTARVWIGKTFQARDVGDVFPGDIIEVRAGDRVPVDGTVATGEGYVDEAMVTGEPLPVAKSAGDALIGGTVNQATRLTMRAEAVGRDTLLSQIIQIVEQAQGDKLPIQAMVDRVTRVFVPVIMGFAALTFVVWLWLGPEPALALAAVNAVAVLVIACPCAMGLATPMSIMVGTGRGAELGILFRKGDALQALQSVKAVAFDKTGTLTQGRPSLTDVSVVDGWDRGGLLAHVAAVEASSSHPVAQAMVRAAHDQGVPDLSAAEISEMPGKGVTGTVAGKSVSIGTLVFMRDLGVHISDQWVTSAETLAADGNTAVYVSVSGQFVGLLAVSDPIKPSSRAVVQALRQQGLAVAMVTGDTAPAAQAVARQIGIDHVVAEVLPGGKVDAVQDLQRQFGAVAFVGDGINDAPALATADVGLALSTGTEIAVEAAEVVLVAGSVQAVPAAIALSWKTLQNIRQNLFWAFAYNAALVPVAAGVLYPAFGLLLSPMLAAGAMAASSVFVVMNALRLSRFSAISWDAEVEPEVDLASSQTVPAQ
ncbi:MAG: heavy metal translocating P-type ATPase [Pseudomonadota bacterium]